MIVLDCDLLECDLAETYLIYDMRQLRPSKIAVFASGLRDNSRIKTKIAGLKAPIDTVLMAGIFDGIQTLIWSKCKDGTPKPHSLMERFMELPEKESKNTLFDSIEDFETARQKIIGGT